MPEWLFAARARFIPAHAGNARSSLFAFFQYTVHPRTRGERFMRVHQLLQRDGSSPHTRGTRPNRATACYPKRFIPAHAGNAANQLGTRLAAAVHPRTRGERAALFRQI